MIQYHGKMSHKAREKSVLKFGQDPEVKIMIASLKCGGIGLVSTLSEDSILIERGLIIRIELDHGHESHLHRSLVQQLYRATR